MPKSAPSSAGPSAPAAEVRLVEDARNRSRLRLSGRDRLATLASGLGFVATAFALSLVLPAGQLPSLGVLGLLVVSYAILSRVEFELGPGTVLPTELALVPILFLLPPAAVAPVVAVSFVLGGLPDILRGRMHPQRVFVRLSYSWHAIGPVLVFAIFSPGRPSWGDGPVYALALASQFVFDACSSIGREWFGVGVAPRALAPVLARAYLVDLLLAPVGFLAALAAVNEPFGFVAVVPLAVLFALLAADRRERIGKTIDLTDAFETASTVARVDALTGLANRLAWEERVELLGREHARGRPLAVILIDLDGLKLANDARGHAFGDLLLRTAAEILGACVGDKGLAARIGGDEFGVLLANSDSTACEAILARIEDVVERRPPLDGFSLSFSLGAASSPPEPTLAAAIDRADRRMYDRKRQTRPARRGARPGSGG